jgi:hypothetical protein
MVNSLFEGILKDLEFFFKCHLEPDQNDSCLIHLGNLLSLQIELDSVGHLLIGSRLGRVLAGPYRNNLLRAALKSNDTFPPSTGVLGFSQKSQQLILFIYINPSELHQDQISSILLPFIQKAKRWREAISSNEIPIIEQQSNCSSKGLFDLVS